MKRPEHQLQVQVCDLLTRRCREEFYWTAIENGGERHIKTALRLKAAGVKPGTPDIVILMNNKAAWIELKSEKGRLSFYQKGFAAKCQALDHYWGMARTIGEAEALLTQWQVLKPKMMRDILRSA